MTTDLLEAKQRDPEKAVLEQVEQYQQEILKERFALTKKVYCPVTPKKDLVIGSVKIKTISEFFLNPYGFSHAGIHLSAYVRRVKH